MATNQDKADALKAQGNVAFREKKWNEAIDYFTQAIALTPENHVLYSNRSGAYAADGKYEKALEDADKVIAINPSWPKGYSRKATALSLMGNVDEALKTYNEGLKKCPDDPALTKALDDLLSQQMGGSFNPMAKVTEALRNGSVWQTIANSPQLSPYMGDPTFVSNVQALQKDPKAIESMMQDPRMIALLGALMGIQMPMSTDEQPEAPASEKVPPKVNEQPPQPAEPEELTEEQQLAKEADIEKQHGNAAYKKRDFDTALEHYRKAQTLAPANMVYVLNESAVLFELKEWEQCRGVCQRAIDIGRDNRADFSQMAKAYARMGNTYFQEGQYEASVPWYQKSLTEHRVKDVLNQLNKAEKLANEAKVSAYIDPEEAQKEKARGNEFFKNSNFPEAVKAYTEAIRRNPDDHVLYSNRAAAYMKLGALPTALADCEKCISLDPQFVKGYTRKANCLLFLKEFSRALQTYEEVLKLDPANQEAEEGIRRTMAAMQQKQVGMSQEQIAEEAMKDPEVQEIMADPVMRQILSQMQNDPAAVKDHLSNPVVAKKIEKLIMSGIIKIG